MMNNIDKPTNKNGEKAPEKVHFPQTWDQDRMPPKRLCRTEDSSAYEEVMDSCYRMAWCPYMMYVIGIINIHHGRMIANGG